jgi:hypothetical protein
MPLKTAPYRQKDKIFLTPIIADVLFSETVDCTRKEIPPYGTAHPDKSKWPHHKLVFVQAEEQSGRDEVFIFFYAADRESQDLYNFQSGSKDIVRRDFRVVARSYVTPREGFEPHDVPFAAPMPDVPEGKFEGVEYLFYERTQTKIDQKELDSLYVAETLTYVERSLFDDYLLYGKEIPNPIPEKFRSQIPTHTLDTVEEGLASEPTLGEGELSRLEDQINFGAKRIRVVTNSAPELPVCLPDGEVIVRDFGGVVATREECLVAAGTSAESGFGVLESQVNSLNATYAEKVVVRAPQDENGNPIFPELDGGRIDPRYGVPLLYKRKIVPAGSIEAAVVVQEDGTGLAYEVEPRDQWHSFLNTFFTYLPDPQVWYGLRRENLPEELESIEIVGTERYIAVPTWKRVVDGPMKSRHTRTFTYGPPPEFDPTNTRVYYASQAFQAAREYLATSITTTVSSGTNNSVGSNTSTSNGTSSNTNESSSTSQSSSETVVNSDGSSSGTSTSSQQVASTSNSAGSFTSDQSSQSTSAGVSTSQTANGGTSTQSSSNTSSNTGTSNSTGLNSSRSESASNTTSSTGTESDTEQVVTDLDADPPTTKSVSITRSESVGVAAGSISEGGSISETRSENVTSSTSSGTNASSGTSSSDASGTSTSSSSNSSQTQSSGTSTSSNTGDSTSNSSGSSTSTNDSYNHSVSSSDSSSTTRNTSSGTNSGTNQSTSNSTSESQNNSTSESTGLTLLTITIPKCLHPELIVALPDGGEIVIPPTTPTGIPSGWLEVSRQSEHWANGVWVTEVVEVLVP